LFWRSAEFLFAEFHQIICWLRQILFLGMDTD
jgi:hypothetical protein